MYNKEDNQLIIDYLAGDEDAFAGLVDKYLAATVNFVYSLVGDRQTAEDIAQESFLRVWKNLKRFQLGKSFKPWLFTIAKNISLDYWRRQKARPVLELSLDDDELLGAVAIDGDNLPDELFDRSLAVEQVDDLVSSLNSAERVLVELYYHNELTLEEAAEVLGQPINTVKSRHRRLILKLKSKIANIQ
jgi:RNA polymerase sigma-70 factor (ECF subfamily)